MELEPMTSKELVALGQSPNVQGLPENVRHRVLWAILQATAANALEARLEAAAPVADAVEWVESFSEKEERPAHIHRMWPHDCRLPWYVECATRGAFGDTLPAAVAKLKERETR